MKFGEAIRCLRKSYGMTLVDFARALAVSVQYASAVEIGRKGPFSGGTLEKAYDTFQLNESQRAEFDALRSAHLQTIREKRS